MGNLWAFARVFAQKKNADVQCGIFLNKLVHKHKLDCTMEFSKLEYNFVSRKCHFPYLRGPRNYGKTRYSLGLLKVFEGWAGKAD